MPQNHFLTHILRPFFPENTPPPTGGYTEHHAYDWTPQDDGVRSLVFQSRHLWVASQAARYFQKTNQHQLAQEFADHADNAQHTLLTRLHDPQEGAFHWAVDHQNQPTHPQGHKHAYGLAFAIYGLAAHHRLTQNPDSLQHALQTLDWLENHAHDPAHDGYHESLDRQGRPLPPHPQNKPQVGPGPQYRTSNTHMHLLEALTELLQTVPDPQKHPLVTTRLAEIHRLILDRMAVPPGALHEIYNPDWTPVPAPDSYGHDVEAAFLLLEAEAALTRRSPVPPDPRTWPTARNLLLNPLRVGLHPLHPYLVHTGTPFGQPIDPTCIWWVQAELLNALATVPYRTPHPDPECPEDQALQTLAPTALANLWAFVQNHLVDHQNHGYHPHLVPKPDHSLAPDKTYKSNPWTEAYHQSRALLSLLQSPPALQNLNRQQGF